MSSQISTSLTPEQASQKTARDKAATAHYGKSLFAGIVLVIVGLVFLVLVGQVVQVNCSRAAGGTNCSIQNMFLGFIPLGSQQVNGVSAAALGESCAVKDVLTNGCAYRVELVQGGVNTPVTNIYLSGQSGAQQAMQQINTYIQSGSSDPMTINASGPLSLINIVFPIGMIILGILLARYQIRGRPRWLYFNRDIKYE